MKPTLIGASDASPFCRSGMPLRIRLARLSIRPRPILNESAYSYLVRVTHANGYATPSACWRAMRLCAGEDIACVRSALMLSENEFSFIQGPLPSYAGIDTALPYKLLAEHFEGQWMRWCPECLTESEHLRIEWSIKLCCVCTAHGVVLRDRCSSCGDRQRLERPRLARCLCGASLSQGFSERAPTDCLELQKWMLEGLHGDRARPPFDLSSSEWTRLITYLGRFDGNRVPARPGKVASVRDVESALALTARTAKLLSNWPIAFHAFLGHQHELFCLSPHIGEAFGSLYRVLYRELNATAFEFLRLAFEDYVRGNWVGLLGRRNRRLSCATVLQHSRKPLGVIAEQSGAGKAVLRHLALAGEIHADAVHHASGRTTWSVPDEEASRVRGFLADWITLHDASTRLGISRARVRELIDAQLLQVRIRKSTVGASTWLLSRSSVCRLAQLGHSSRHVMGSVWQCDIGLSKLLKTWRLRDGEFPALLRAIETGKLCPVRRSRGGAALATIVLSADDVSEWLRERRAQSDVWLSVDAAAKLLGLKQQVAYELVARGLLESRILSGAGGFNCCVHCDAIGAFRHMYVALAQIAREKGTSSRSMLGRLLATPVCGPAVDGARQYFYRWDDVKEDRCYKSCRSGES